MSSGPESGVTSGPQMSLDQYESEQKAKENENKVASNLSQNDNVGNVDLPKDKSQLNHIFGDRPGHLPDTLKNRQKITDLTNNRKNFVGTDNLGNDWYASTSKDGSQLWAKVHNKTVSDAGKNDSPRQFDSESGLNNNPKKNNKWRKKKK